MAITDKDVAKLKKVFATKDDLKNFTTKDDLKNFVTKDDLKNELKSFATKDELISTKWELINKIDNLKQDLKQEITEKYDKILDGQDYLIKKVETALQETKVAYGQYKQQENKLADHENRIKVIETIRS